MDSEAIEFPEKIRLELERINNERYNKLDEHQKKVFGFLLDPNMEIKGDKKAFQQFFVCMKCSDLKKDFLNLIKNFEDLEVYERFLASILIYTRINELSETPDKFLYFCIAIEAAMQFKSTINNGKEELFRKFFKENLETDDKIKMISHFQNNLFKNYVDYPDFLEYKNNSKHSVKKTKKDILLPVCYKQKRCCLYLQECNVLEGCCLKENPDKVNGYLDLVLKYLYQKRSNFVHDGRIPSFETQDVYYEDNRRKENSIPVYFSLGLYDLSELYEKALLNRFKTLNGV